MSSLVRSLALVELPDPDYADVLICPLPANAPTDPAVWARTLFARRSMPHWVRAALAVRQLLVPLLGIRRTPADAFEVTRVEEREALISVRERHLDVHIGVGIDPEARLVQVTTAVRLHGRRGRLYFWPVRVGHAPVVDALLRRAGRGLAAE